MLLLGMFLQTLEVYFSITREGTKFLTSAMTKILPATLTCLLFFFLLKQQIAFCVITSLVVLLLYRFSYLQVMKSLPMSFTLGEASIVTQAFIVFIFNCYLKLQSIDKAKSTSEELTNVLQIGLLAVVVITFVTYLIPVFRKSLMFYVLLVAVILGVCLITINGQPAMMILWNFIFNDIERVAVVGAYVVLLTAAGFAVSWQIGKNQRGTTSTRKIFHILIVLVFVPGLIYQCLFLYVASVVVLAIFIVLEVARVIELYPVAEVLEKSVDAFIDEKDAGKVALTPIYLLVGCSLPLWIHNSPCDLTGSTAFELLPLISGVLSIGIGDTAASIIGSKLGRNKWPGTKKSVEGTIASILAQAAFIYSLNLLGYLPLTTRLTAVSGIAVILNSLIEALTDQVDNLVLPIITYVILAF